MEKTLTRLKSNLNKSRRKLSLPMLAVTSPAGQLRTPDEEEGPAPMSLTDDVVAASSERSTWLSFGRTRMNKNRNKPRRWPSTPAFHPTSRPVSTQTSAAAVPTRPQPYIQGYHLTLPSFLTGSRALMNNNQHPSSACQVFL